MYRRTAFVLVVVLLALIQPLKAQDTATVSDRQLRQRIDASLNDTRRSIQDLNQLLLKMEAMRAAVNARIARDSLASRGTTGTTRTPTGTTGGPSVPVTGGPSAVAPVFEDNFEGGGPAATRNGYGWVGFRPNGGDGVALSRDVARAGSGSMRFTYSGSPDLCADSWAEQRFQFGENLPEVWMEYYVYLPKGGPGGRFTHRRPVCAREEDPNGTIGNNKFLALWDTAYSIDKGGSVRALLEYRRTPTGADGDSYLYGMWGTDTRTAGNYDQPGSSWDPAFTDAVRGRWVQVRVHARVADSKQAANGVFQLWADGALKIDMQGLDLAPNAGGARFFRNGYLMGWANSGFDQSTTVYVDDFKIFNSNPGWQ